MSIKKSLREGKKKISGQMGKAGGFTLNTKNIMNTIVLRKNI